MVYWVYSQCSGVGVVVNVRGMSGSGMRFSGKVFFTLSVDIVSFQPLTSTMKSFNGIILYKNMCSLGDV